MKTQFTLCEAGTENMHCILALPWVTLLVVVHWPRGLGFEPGPFNVRFLVLKVALRQVHSEHFGFLPSVSFHQCSIFILICKAVVNRSTNGSSMESSQRKRHFYLFFYMHWISSYWFQSDYMCVQEKHSHASMERIFSTGFEIYSSIKFQEN
jgi:hypothetical protein